MNDERPVLAFVSPVFLFPNDAGGKIRTTQILRGLKGGRFRIVLAAPATPALEGRWAAELASVCDEFVAWAPAPPRAPWRRVLDLADPLPVNVVADRTPAARAAVAALAARPEIDVLVYDFVHAAVLMPPRSRAATVCFTHNVEAEIFARHAAHASDAARRWLWTSQRAKMETFERDALARFTRVVAVSERDARHFAERYELERVGAIPTGVDLDHYGWQAPPVPGAGEPPTVVFTGSMDWIANVDAVTHFLRECWPRVRSAVPEARFVVVGRNPPPALAALARAHEGVELTGFVDDVRRYVHAAQAFVIPLRVGGGTRIKAFEAMAMGCPVVSTALGMEGLGARADLHYLERDDPAAMADAVVLLLRDAEAGLALSRRARSLVESRYGHEVAAAAFERQCEAALRDARGAAESGNPGRAALRSETLAGTATQ